MENTLIPEVFLDFSSFSEAVMRRKLRGEKNQGKPLEPGYMEKPNFAISSLLSIKL